MAAARQTEALRQAVLQLHQAAAGDVEHDRRAERLPRHRRERAAVGVGMVHDVLERVRETTADGAVERLAAELAAEEAQRRATLVTDTLLSRAR